MALSDSQIHKIKISSKHSRARGGPIQTPCGEELQYSKHVRQRAAPARQGWDTGSAADSKGSSQSRWLTHFHEELSLLHHGLASFTAFLDHSAEQQKAEHAAMLLPLSPTAHECTVIYEYWWTYLYIQYALYVIFAFTMAAKRCYTSWAPHRLLMREISQMEDGAGDGSMQK